MPAARSYHPIFYDIHRGDLAAVQRRVLADPAVLEERGVIQTTPLMYAIQQRQPAIAHWLIEHRGRRALESRDEGGSTALHFASYTGLLSVARSLVEASADPVALNTIGTTPLMVAACAGHADIVAFLLQLPAVKASINHTSPHPYTALSLASWEGRPPVVQLLLDAGADPTIHAGNRSPLNLATRFCHHAIAALLRRAIDEPNRARALLKARSLLDTAHTVQQIKAGNAPDHSTQPDQPRRMTTRGERKRKAVAAAPAFLKGRVKREEPLPRVMLNNQGDELLRGVVAGVLALPREVFDAWVLGCMVPAWADRGAEDESDDDDSDEDRDEGV